MRHSWGPRVMGGGGAEPTNPAFQRADGCSSITVKGLIAVQATNDADTSAVLLPSSCVY